MKAVYIKRAKIGIGFVVLLIVIIIGTYFGVRWHGKICLQKDVTGEWIPEKDVINILCIGVDKEERMDKLDDDGKSIGQADAIFVISLDLEGKDIRIVAVPRDTMVMIKNYAGTDMCMTMWKGQLALQYACGDGQEQSCEQTLRQVSKLLGGIPIHGYVAINLSCIPVINDAIGGVELTMDDDYTLYHPAFEKGATVHLEGEMAKNYVQGRDITVSGSAYSRIHRQKQYLNAFMEQAKKTLKNDVMLPITLLQELEGDLVTDIETTEVLYLATEIVDYSFSEENMYILPGQIEKGEEYEEYYLDETAVEQMIYELFGKVEKAK